MPPFIVQMSIRYILISLAITVTLTGISIVLMTYGHMDHTPSSLGHVVVIGAGMWAGTYFAKQTGRVADWSECFRIGAVLVALQIALSAVILVVYTILPGGGLGGLTADLTPGLLGVLAGLLVFTGLLYWVGTAAFLRMGSKSALKAKRS